MNDKQRQALANLSERYNVNFSESFFFKSFDCGPNWVEGWIGGPTEQKLFVGCSPEGEIHS